MPSVNRELLRNRVRAFVHSRRFDRHYDQLYVGALHWHVIMLIYHLSRLKLRPLVRAWGNPGYAYKSSRLRRAYEGLVETGRIVRAFTIMGNTELDGDPHACLPAVVIASLEGTDAGDARAERLWHGMQVDAAQGRARPAVEIVAAMLEDEQYFPGRKRLLPAGFAEAREMYLIDVRIDQELKRDCALFSAEPMYFVVDPSPGGLVLQIPEREPDPRWR